jgi:hypothetical protein
MKKEKTQIKRITHSIRKVLGVRQSYGAFSIHRIFQCGKSARGLAHSKTLSRNSQRFPDYN